MPRSADAMRVAVCMAGEARSLETTAPSIRHHILTPLTKIAHVVALIASVDIHTTRIHGTICDHTSRQPTKEMVASTLRGLGGGGIVLGSIGG